MSPEMVDKLKLDCVPRFLFIKNGNIYKELKGMMYVEYVETLEKCPPDLPE